MVAGRRYDTVCDLPVLLMLPVVGQVAVRAAWVWPPRPAHAGSADGLQIFPFSIRERYEAASPARSVTTVCERPS